MCERVKVKGAGKATRAYIVKLVRATNIDYGFTINVTAIAMRIF